MRPWQRAAWILAALGLLGPAASDVVTLSWFSAACWTATIAALGIDRARIARRTRELAAAAPAAAYAAFAVLALGETAGAWSVGWVVIWLGLALAVGLASLPRVLRRGSGDTDRRGPR